MLSELIQFTKIMFIISDGSIWVKKHFVMVFQIQRDYPQRIRNIMLAAMEEVKPATKEAFSTWIESMEVMDASKEATAKLLVSSTRDDRFRPAYWK